MNYIHSNFTRRLCDAILSMNPIITDMGRAEYTVADKERFHATFLEPSNRRLEVALQSFEFLLSGECCFSIM